MKRLILASAALLTITALSLPASAATSTATASGNGSLPRKVIAIPKAVVLPTTDLEHENIMLICTAAAAPDALSVIVESCYLKGTGAIGGTYSLPSSGGTSPGPAATDSGVLLGLPAQTYVACMSARGVFRGGTNGDIIDTGTVCG